MSESRKHGLGKFGWRLVIGVALALLLLFPALGQEESRVLTDDAPVAGVLDEQAASASYVFDAGADASATISLDNVVGSALTLLLSDINGSEIARASQSGENGAAISDVALENAGRYFVFVHFAPGAAIASTSFDISVSFAGDSAQAAAAVQQAPQANELILLGAGIEASLSWNGAADLNLEVRDPTGQALHWNSRTTDNGGSFGFDANGLCEVISPEPVETALWQPGFVSTGSYEVIIYYKQACDALTATVFFDLEVRVDGVAIGNVNQALTPTGQTGQNVYVTRFEVAADGSGVLRQGGPNPDASLTLLPGGYDFASDQASPILRDVPVTGFISNARPFATYAFVAAADEIVSINMEAIGPSLDTLLQIVDPAGKVVYVNDDAFVGNTNSVIANARLLNSGTYAIVATRYAKENGGTVGRFQLTLTGATSDVAGQLSDLNLPQGDVEVSLFWSSGADLQLLVRDPSGESVFDDIPVVSSGGVLQLAGNVNCVPAATVSPVSYIYWAPGSLRPGAYEVEVWYQNACAELPPPTDFTLRIEVMGQVVADAREFPQPGQRFVTNFTVQPNGSASAGEAGFIDAGSSTLSYQDQVLDAPEILSGEPVTGVIGADNAFDLYQFFGVAGETVEIRMEAATQTLDTNLYLLSPSGREIAANDDANPVLLGASGRTTDSLISGFVLTENGPYAIIATRYANQYGGTIGFYTLTLDKS